VPATGLDDAARGLLAAARAAAPPATPQSRATPPKPPPPPRLLEPPADPPAEPLVAPEPEASAEGSELETGADASSAPAAPAAEMPAIYRFEPMRSVRRFLSLMLLTGLVASGYLGYLAYQSRDNIDIGIAATVALATAVIWAIRAGATVTVLTVRRGQLEISRQGGRMVFDLASTYTDIQVVGRPGSKKWKVLFVRRGMSPVVIDGTMVDPVDFMRVLKFFRPDLAH
jgi:hypothetical protein